MAWQNKYQSRSKSSSCKVLPSKVRTRSWIEIFSIQRRSSISKAQALCENRMAPWRGVDHPRNRLRVWLTILLSFRFYMRVKGYLQPISFNPLSRLPTPSAITSRQRSKGDQTNQYSLAKAGWLRLIRGSPSIESSLHLLRDFPSWGRTKWPIFTFPQCLIILLREIHPFHRHLCCPVELTIMLGAVLTYSLQVTRSYHRISSKRDWQTIPRLL